MVLRSRWTYIYKAVFGTVHGIYNDQETLGIKTNSQSTNWYVSIGNMLVAGCQIKYCCKCNSVSYMPPLVEGMNDGKLVTTQAPITRIYNADNDYYLK